MTQVFGTHVTFEDKNVACLEKNCPHCFMKPRSPKAGGTIEQGI